MKRLQKKLLWVIVGGIILVTLTMGTIVLYGYGRTERNRTREDLRLKVTDSVHDINNAMMAVEKLTAFTVGYFKDTMPSKMLYEGEEFEQYVSNSWRFAQNIVEYDELIGAVFYRFNIEKAPPTAGFFLSKNKITGEFEELGGTDISKYDPSERERVGWYYEPIEAGEAIWMSPYYNKNNQILTISYVIPLYDKAEELVGVVGIDLDFEALCNIVSEISFYENDGIFLYDESGMELFASKEPMLSGENITKVMKAETGIVIRCRENKTEYEVVSYTLENNNRLIYVVPTAETSGMERQNVLALLLTIVLMIVSLIGVLTKLVQRTFRKSQEDVMTKAYNRDAYLSDVFEIERNFSNGHGRKVLNIIVFDVNGLKRVNDTYGHVAGDTLIVEAYQLIKQFFPDSVIYRCGGDEFVIVDTKTDAAMLQLAVERFKLSMEQRLQDYVKDERTALVSVGMASFDEKKHNSYEDVFAEADHQMFLHKQKFYERFPKLKR